MPSSMKAFYSLILPTALIFCTAFVSRVEFEIEKPQNLITEPKITQNIGYTRIDRENTLKAFFLKYKSPLVDYTGTFIKVADENNLDYRLLPAISCIESSCGKRLIPDSHNPFGWGIYGNNVLKFKNYDEGIAKVGEGLNKNYIAKGFDTPEKIAPVYNPPSHQSWLGKLRYFMNEMDKVQTTSGIISDASLIK